MLSLVTALSLLLHIAVGVDPPTLVITNGPAPGYGFNFDTVYILECQGALDAGCTIQWAVDGILELRVDGRDYRFRLSPVETTYRCSFVCNNGQDLLHSDLITAKPQTLERVVIVNSGRTGDLWQPLADTTLELVCDSTYSSTSISKAIHRRETETFEWTVAGNVEGTERTFRLLVLPGMDATVQCKVTNGFENAELSSALVRVQQTDVVDEPDVIFSTDNEEQTEFEDIGASQFFSELDYVGHCRSTAHNADATYIWTRDYFTLPDVPFTWDFKVANSDRFQHEGVYRCRMIVNGNEYCSRNAVDVTVIANGRFCQSDRECTGLGASYTGTCRNERCDCAGDIVKFADRCGVAHIMASSVLILMALVVAYMV